jgi:hypothetical protein
MSGWGAGSVAIVHLVTVNAAMQRIGDVSVRKEMTYPIWGLLNIIESDLVRIIQFQ